MRWYYERSDFAGRFYPCVSTDMIDPPREGRDKMSQFTIRRVREIAPEHFNLSMDMISFIYGTPAPKEEIATRESPCPFCGSMNLVFEVATDDDFPRREGLNYVGCRDCGCVGGFWEDMSSAIAYWNRRADCPTD